jgi:protocatechuate 3,4-dioxygenase, beta subunit
METKTNFIFLVIFTSLLLSCNGQTISNSKNSAEKNGIIGGPFENGEFMYIGMPENIKSIDTSAGWTQKGQKLLVTGTIYKLDGKTPAPDVILYYYHTDINGEYAGKQRLDPRVVRHGYIRGWVKSDANGKYAIYTVRPAPYPNRNFEAHIHPAIKEPNIDKEYYIDEFIFDDDKLLTGEKRKRLENRGGSGILRVLISGDLQIAEHNIILGLNIPNYPETDKAEKQSGLEIGEDNPSFIPYHAFGPDKGTRTCPVCKYGRFHGIVYFVGNNPNWDDIKKWLTFLEQESVKRSKYLKAYFVYGNEKDYNKNTRQKELENIGLELNLKNIALTFVPSMTDTESEVNLNKINPGAENTFVIFKHRAIIDKFINFKATAGNYKIISSTLDKTKGDYFNLSEPKHE